MIEDEDKLISYGVRYIAIICTNEISAHLSTAIARIAVEYACCDFRIIDTISRDKYHTSVTLDIDKEAWQCDFTNHTTSRCYTTMKMTHKDNTIDFETRWMDHTNVCRFIMGDDDEMMVFIEKKYRDQFDGPALKTILHLTNVLDRLARALFAKFTCVEIK